MNDVIEFSTPPEPPPGTVLAVIEDPLRVYVRDGKRDHDQEGWTDVLDISGLSWKEICVSGQAVRVLRWGLGGNDE